jgi:hypothetical protein
MNHYVFWCLASFGLLMLVLIWAAQWIAGRLHPLRLLVLVGAVGALALGTELPRLLVYGYPSETLGLCLAVVLAALVIRPVAGTREQLVLLGALLAGLGFAYYLFLFPAGALVLLWLVLQRRRLAARRGTLLVVALVTAAFAPVTALLGLLVGGQSEALVAEGTGVESTYDTLLVLCAVVGAGLVARSGLAQPVWRRHLAALVISLGFAAAIALVNLYEGIEPGYYFAKAAHFCLALLIVGVGALVRLLPVPAAVSGERPAGVLPLARHWAPSVALAGLVTVAVLAASGVLSWTGGFFHIDNGQGGTTWARKWVTGNFQREPMARVVAAAERQFPAVPGTVTLIVDETPMAGAIDSMFLSTLQGTTAQTEPGIYGMQFFEPERTRQILLRNSSVRLIVAHPHAQAAIDQALARSPELATRVTVVTLVR